MAMSSVYPPFGANKGVGGRRRQSPFLLFGEDVACEVSHFFFLSALTACVADSHNGCTFCFAASIWDYIWRTRPVLEVEGLGVRNQTNNLVKILSYLWSELLFGACPRVCPASVIV